MNYNLAIDGPAGAGKSTIAKKIAKKMGFIYVDTGAMYRAMGLYLMQEGIDPSDSDAISLSCNGADISICYDEGEQIVLLNGENVNHLIRTPQVSRMASMTSANKQVRKRLVELQKELARNNNVVMDGRDIGTCVLPDANLKIYLTASTFVRAKRRYDEMLLKGEECNLSDIEKDIAERDERDMTREESPLKQAEDAVLVDSSYMTIDEVVKHICDMIKLS